MITKNTNRMIDGAAVNVLDFGAVGDGVTDDTAAIQAALDYVASVGGTLVFPNATYKLNSPVAVTATESIILEGENSVLLCDSSGISITQNAEMKYTDVRDLEFQANGTLVSSTALALDFPLFPSTQSRSARVSNVTVRQPLANKAQYFFNVGIKLTNAWQYFIDKCLVKGSLNTTEMEACYYIDGQSTDGRMRNSYGYFADYGFYAPLSSESEGTNILSTYFIYVDYGIYVTPTLQQPLFILDNIHVNSLVQCLHFERMDQMLFSNLLLYIRGEAVGTWEAVYLDDCNNGIFTNIITAGTNAVATKDAIKLLGCGNNQFENLTLVSTHGKIIEDDSCASNVFNNVKVVDDQDTARPYLESGILSGRSYLQPLGATSTTYRLNTDQSIPSGGVQNITWNANVELGSLGLSFFDAGLVNMVMPNGINGFTVGAYLVWEANSGGIRSIIVEVDGVVVQRDTVNATAAGNTYHHINVRPLNTGLGNNITIKTEQSSGVALNLKSGSYFTCTAI